MLAQEFVAAECCIWLNGLAVFDFDALFSERFDSSEHVILRDCCPLRPLFHGSINSFSDTNIC